MAQLALPRVLSIAMLAIVASHAFAMNDATPDACRALFRTVLDSSETLRAIAGEPARYRLQILFAEIDNGPEARPRGLWYPYRENAEYWYPASTVKLFGAAAALRRLEEIRGDPGAGWVSADAPMVFHPLFEGELEQSRDASNTDTGAITLGNDVRNAIIVSDNGAFNRLYELAGQDGIQALAHDAGLASVYVVHRLSESRSAEENLLSPRIDFVDGASILTVPERRSRRATEPLVLESLPGAPEFLLGRAHLDRAGRVVQAPMSFAGKNFVALRDLVSLVGMVARPDVDLDIAGRLELSEPDRLLLLDAMTTLPSDSRNPRFDPVAHPDEDTNFFLGGIERVVPRGELRIANKVGLAYGFVSEAAYVEHTPSGRGFLLGACLYANDNAVLNDNVYEYDLAIEALADIGEALARRVFGDRDASRGARPAAGALIEAPTRWAHEHRQVLGASGWAARIEAGGVWTIAPIRPSRPFTELVASWNVDVPAGAGCRLEVRASADGDAWSDWLGVGEIGEAAPQDEWISRSPGYRADVDTLVSEAPMAWMQVRVRSAADSKDGVTLRRVDVCTSSMRAEPAMVRDERLTGRVAIDTPYLANSIEDGSLRSRLCSPLSLRMLMAQRGVTPPLDALVEEVHDPRFDIYGGWTRAIEAAFERGVPGYLTRFADWASVREHLERVGPIAISVTFERGELTNAPYDAQDGHIMVLYGLDEHGNALVLDPALSPESEARRTYARDELSRLWLDRVKGLAYVLLPADSDQAR